MVEGGSSNVLDDPMSIGISDEDKTKCENKGEEEGERMFRNQLTSHCAKLTDISRIIKELVLESKALEREFNVTIKKFKRSSKQKRRVRALSGFAVPIKLSDELYSFLNIEPATTITRKDITKMMNDYIVKNNCRDETDRRKIIPNEALIKLFKCDENENITYFDLQSHMKKHFVR